MDVWFSIWLFFRYFFFVLAGFYLLSGLDDLIVDAIFYVRLFFRKVFRRGVIRPVTRAQLDAVEEKRVAIIVPAWDESTVIGRMLLNTINTVHYRNYQIFVGTYPNDEATKLEVEKIREIYPNIQVVVTPADGPTNKADCLNWIFQGIKVFEKDHDCRFEFFVFHDAEDVIHPLSLKYYNFLMPRIPFIQVPVFPLEQEWSNMTVGMYMDEFAENHTKDLRVREVLAKAIPSAGVGTAMTREAMDYLAALRNNQLFDIRSLTEDYVMGLSLKDMPGRKILLQQVVEREVRETDSLGRPVVRRVKEQLATREFFPSTFATAVHQKSRWILGISLQGWSFGWTGRPGSDYCLMRDRKSLLSNLLTVVGYVVVVYWGLSALIGAMNPAWAVPPLVSVEEPAYVVVQMVMVLFFWRLFNRAVCTWHVYGPLQGVLAVPRLFYGNFLNFAATWVAIRRYVGARLAGKVPEWGKTAHAYPSEEQLRTFRRKLGDLLLDRRLITAVQLEAALARQKESGGRLGEVLVGMGVITADDLQVTLSHQQGHGT